MCPVVRASIRVEQGARLTITLEHDLPVGVNVGSAVGLGVGTVDGENVGYLDVGNIDGVYVSFA
jgi:hypothetical protein